MRPSSGGSSREAFPFPDPGLHRVCRHRFRAGQDHLGLSSVPCCTSCGRLHDHCCKPEGDRRIGVIWHTQGSGKSLLMTFYTGQIIAHPEMENPTIVLITDRNDLDDQLFGTFSMCKDLLRRLQSRRKIVMICRRCGGVLPAEWCSPPSRNSTLSVGNPITRY